MHPVRIVLVGEALGEKEHQIGASFVGPSGVELLRMLGEAKVIRLSTFDRQHIRKFWETQDPRFIARVWDMHPEIYRTNVFMQHPPKNDLKFFCGLKPTAIPGYPILEKSKYVREEFQYELDRLATELAQCNPQLIICLGNAALWALAGRTGITKYRGTTLLSTHTITGFKLLPTVHPAYILRQWENRPTVLADLMKANREADFPEIRRPHRAIWIEPSLEDIQEFYQSHIIGCRLLSVDIETSGSLITCIGLSPSPSLAIVIPLYDGRRKDGNYWKTGSDEAACWGIIRNILEDATIPKLFHNGLYDIGFLYKCRMRIRTMGATEDSMLLAHALQPEMKKALGFLGSIYSEEGAWKHLRKKDETIKREA